MEEVYWFSYHKALFWATRFLPERMWEDVACDFRSYLRQKAGSEENLIRWVQAAPAYVNRCARNYVLDQVRTLHRHPEVSLFQHIVSASLTVQRDFPASVELPDDALNREAFWREIVLLLDRRPKRAVQILLLSYRKGASRAEIATATGLTINAVSLVLSRALKAVALECETQGVTQSDLTDLL